MCTVLFEMLDDVGEDAPRMFPAVLRLWMSRPSCVHSQRFEHPIKRPIVQPFAQLFAECLGVRRIPAFGSGVTESGVMHYNKRVKGTEQSWTPSGVDAILALRALLLSQDERWDRY